MIYFYYGDEDYIIDSEIEKLKSKLDKNFIDMSFKVYDNPNFADLISIISSQPMMFGKMLVIINCLNFLGLEHSENELEQFSSTLKLNNENVDIVFCAKIPRDSNKKIDKRRKVFKILSGYESKEWNVIPAFKTDEIEFWIKKFAKSVELKVSTDAAQTLINQVGNNLRDIKQEIEKLKLFISPKDIISKEDVEKFCISNEDFFAFTDYLSEGKKGDALLEYTKLLDKKHPMEILAGLHTIVRKWILIKAKSGEMSLSELSKLVGMKEYPIKLLINRMKNVTLKDLVNLKLQLTEAEYKIKSGKSFDVNDEVMNVIAF